MGFADCQAGRVCTSGGTRTIAHKSPVTIARVAINHPGLQSRDGSLHRGSFVRGQSRRFPVPCTLSVACKRDRSAAFIAPIRVLEFQSAAINQTLIISAAGVPCVFSFCRVYPHAVRKSLPLGDSRLYDVP